MEFLKIILGFGLGLFSSLFVFYITESINNIKNNKVKFLKISIKLKQFLMILISFESSCKQYLELTKYNLKNIGSIGFPNYIFPSINELIPNLLYGDKDKELLSGFNKIEHISFSLNSSLKNLAINEIKGDLLGKRISLEESEIRYSQECKFIDSYLIEISNYKKYIFEVLAKIELINKNNTKSFLLNLKTTFSSKEINNELEIIKREFYRSFYKIEEYVVKK